MRRPYQGLSRSKKNLISDLGNIIAYWEEYYCISAKQGISKQVWFIPENSWYCDSSATSRKFYPHLSLETVFPALKVTKNYYIINIGSSSHHIYPAWTTILTICQNMKTRELSKSQSPNCLVNWEIYSLN